LYKIVDKVQELQNFGVQNLIQMHHIPIDMSYHVLSLYRYSRAEKLSFKTRFLHNQ
jgi:hypothetical protein